MGHRFTETHHLTKEEAEAAQAILGVPGYSEVYGRGVVPCRVINTETGRECDGWKSMKEEYYG